MKYFLKRSIMIIIFVAIEVFSFFKIKPTNLETFFLVWGIISLLLFFNSIFKVYGSPMGLTDIDRTIYANLASSLGETKYDSDKREKRSGGGSFNPKKLLYFLFLVANIIGYIIVLPK